VNDADMEAIVWGPGSNDQAHTQDEYIDLAWGEPGLTILDRAISDLFSDQ
jgi:succinyl-diaminopimelate desuccinylase